MPLSWVEIHGAITHLPLAFLLAVPVFEIGALIFRKPEWRIVSFWLLAGAVVLAVPALGSGWITGDDLGFTGTSRQPPAIFSQHRLIAFIALGLAALLLLWRVKARDQLRGRTHLASIMLSLTIAGAIGWVGYLGGRMVFGDDDRGENRKPDKTRVEPIAKAPTIDPQLVADGAVYYKQNGCQACHRMNGKGGKSGPDLTHEARRHADIEWQIKHLKNPQQMVPGSEMPAFDDLSSQELKALAAYMVTRK